MVQVGVAPPGQELDVEPGLDLVGWGEAMDVEVRGTH